MKPKTMFYLSSIVFILIVLFFINPKFLRPWQEDVKSLKISYKQILSVEVTDEETIENIKQQIEDLPKEQKNAEENILFRISAKNIDYKISAEVEFSQLYWMIMNEFNRDIKQIKLKEDIDYGGGQVHFRDHGVSYDLPEEKLKVTLDELMESTTLREHIFAFQSYPGVEVELVEGLLTLQYITNKIAYVILDGNNLMMVQLPEEKSWGYFKDKYPEHFVRTGFLGTNKINITYGESHFSVEGANNIDSYLRILLPVGNPVEKPEDLKEVGKILIEVENADQSSIEIFENDYWLYNGQYYYKKGIFDAFYGRMSAS